MKKFAIVLCLPLLFLLQSCFIFDSYSVYYRYAAPRIDTMRTRTVNVADYEKKYPEANAVYLGVEGILEPILDGDKHTCQGIIMQRYLVLNPDDDEFSTFTIELGPDEELNAADVLVIAPDGTTKQYKKDAFILEHTHKNLHRYKFAIPGVMKGTIIDAAYNVFSPEGEYYTYYHTLPCQFSEPCELLRYVVVDRSKLGLSLRIGDEREIKMVEYKKLPNGASAFVYEKHDIPALDGEIMAPYGEQKNKEVSFTYFDKEVSDQLYWGGIPFAFQYVLFEKPNFYNQEEEQTLLKTWVKEAVGNAQDDYGKIAGIAAYCAKKIRLRYEAPKAMTMIKFMKRQTGTPYHAAEFVKRLCVEAGIQARLLLAHDARDGNLSFEYRSYGQFDKPGVVCNVGYTQYFIFPEFPEFPPSVVPSPLQGEKSMVIEVGEDKLSNYSRKNPPPYPEMIVLPDTSKQADQQRHEMNLTIENDGSVLVEETRKYDGESAAQIRGRLKSMNSADVLLYLKEWQTYTEFAQTVEKPVIENIENREKPISFHFHYRIPRFVAFNGNTAVLNTRLLFDGIIPAPVRVDTNRSSEIRVYDNNLITRTLSIRFPQQWKLKQLPRSYKTTAAMGTAETRYNQEGSVLQASFTRTMPSGSYKQSAYQELRHLLSHCLVIDEAALLFTTN